MRDPRTRAVLGLTLLLLVLAAAVGVETADLAWAPSYVDGDDGDAGSLPLSERLPALAGSAVGSTPLLAALALVAAGPPARGRPVAPARVRFRAPPLA